MKFFREVVSHLLKNAFEGHAQFSVADDTAIGDDPVRAISLDAVPLNENTMVTLAWEGGDKLFEKSLPEQEASHQFDLISTDLAEVVSLTKQGQYDAAKALMKKLGQKYAENTGDIVDTNLPKLHNTQAAHKHEDLTMPCAKCDKTMCPGCGWSDDDGQTYHNKCKKNASLNKQAFDTDQIEQELHDWILDTASQMKGVPQTKANVIAQDFFYDFPGSTDLGRYVENFVGNEFDLRHYVEDVLMEAEDADVVSAKTADINIWKQAKITMQNLWFTTPDELLEYQKKQKELTGPAANGKNVPLWDQQKGKAPAKDTDLAPASLSYEDAEKEQEKDHEDLQKHIDEKIKTELESALQEKAASVFGPDQIELVKVLRKNGRNWDEIKKILVKDFNFDKDSTNIFIDEQRESLDPTGIEVEPVEEKEEKPLTPPEELVSPETHDKLLQDHEDKKKDNLPVKEPSFTPQDVMDIPEDEDIQDQSSMSNDIARADNDDIHKVAEEMCKKCNHSIARHDSFGCVAKACKCKKPYKHTASLKTAAPSDLNPLQEPVQTEPTTPSQDTVPMGKSDKHNAPQKGDRVFVSSDLTSEHAGFEGSFISNYISQGKEFSIVETDDGDLLDVESHRVTKTAPPSTQETDPTNEPIIEKTPDEKIEVTPKMSNFTNSSQDEALSIKAELDEIMKIVKEADSHVIMPMMYGIDDDSLIQYANGSIYGNKIKSGQMQDKDWESLLKDTARWMTQVGRNKVSQTFSAEAEWFLDPEQVNKLKRMFEVLPKSSSLKTEAAKSTKCVKCDKEGPVDQMVSNEHGAGYLCKSHASEWNKDASLKKQAGTTWTDLEMPEPPEAGWRVKHKSGLTGTVVDGNDKFANVTLDQPIKEDEATCRQLGLSWVQLERGDHPKDVYAIYAEGFGAWNGAPSWLMTDGSGQPILPEGYKLPEHDFNPNPEPAIDTESTLKTATINWKCPKCGNTGTSSDIYDSKICMKDGCNTKMEKQASDFEKGISQNKTSIDNGPSDEDVQEKAWEMFRQHWNGLSSEQMDQVYKVLRMEADASLKTADSTSEEHIMKCPGCGKSVSVGKDQEDARCAECLNKQAAPPTDPTKTQFKDVKITPKYVPKQEATPATPELDAILSKMDALQQNLTTLASAREQIAAKMNAEMTKIDEQGERVQMEAELQESVEKAGVLINALDSKIVQWKDKLLTLQTEEVQYVPKLTQKELLAKIYSKFDGAEKYVKDVLNGMLSLGKNVTEKTLYRWPNRKSSVNVEASPVDQVDAMNEELLAALTLLSSSI